MNTPTTRAERYAEYMQSEHWADLRSGALRNAEYECECCTSRSSLTVHHICYRNLTDCTPKDLIALCERCHRFAHHAFKAARQCSADFSRRETIRLIQKFVAQGMEPAPKKTQPRNLLAFSQRSKHAIRACQNANYTPASVRTLLVELQVIVNSLREVK